MPVRLFFRSLALLGFSPLPKCRTTFPGSHLRSQHAAPFGRTDFCGTGVRLWHSIFFSLI